MPSQSRTVLGPITSNIIRRKELNPYQRGIISELSLTDLTPSQIQCLPGHENLHRQTIYSTLKRTPKRPPSGESLSREGRPSKINERDGRRILREVRTFPKHTYNQVILDLGLDITPRTLSRYLDDFGIKKWRAAKRPELTEDHAKVRLQWALDHVDWGWSEWARVIFYEASIERGIGKERTWVFRTPSQKYDKDKIDTYPKGKQISVMI